MNAPTAIKNAAATKNGGVKAARSDSTLLASLSKALRSPGGSRLWPAAREQETGITYQVRRHVQVGCRHPVTATCGAAATTMYLTCEPRDEVRALSL